MSKKPRESALHLLPVATTHAFNLLSKVERIDLRELSSPQEARLFLGPGEEILVVRDGIARHCQAPWERSSVNIHPHGASRPVAPPLRPLPPLTATRAKPS